MWDASEQKNDEMLRAGTNFLGGISRHREGVCGAVSAMAIFLGYHYPYRIDDADSKVPVRAKTSELAQEFKQRFGSIICQELLGITDMNEEERAEFFAQKKYETACNDYVRYVIEKLLELGDENHDE